MVFKYSVINIPDPQHCFQIFLQVIVMKINSTVFASIKFIVAPKKIVPLVCHWSFFFNVCYSFDVEN
jgi:hypothetical protein